MRLASSSPLRPLLPGQPRGWIAAKGKTCPLTAALAWALVAMLALSLVLGQTLGLVHAVLHGDAVGYGHRQHAVHDGHHEDHDQDQDHDIESRRAQGAEPALPAASGAALEALFGEHEDSSNCRLFDQSSHADVAPGLPPLALAMRLDCSRLVAGLVEQPLPPAWSLFEARGPPTVR